MVLPKGWYLSAKLNSTINQKMTVLTLIKQFPVPVVKQRICLNTEVISNERTNEITNQPTKWSEVRLNKLTGPQFVKKFPAIFGTRRFTTAFTRSCHLSLFRTRLIQCFQNNIKNSIKSNK